MNRTYVIFDKKSGRSIGYTMVEESLLHLVVQSDHEAAELRKETFIPSATYKIVDGYAVRVT